MDLTYSAEDIAYRQRVRQWFEANRPTADLNTLDERKAWHRKLFEAGFIGMDWPKEYGGQEARPMKQAIVADEMGRCNAPSPVIGLGLGIVGPTIVHHGTHAQKARYLRKILTAEEIWCQLFSEPNAGSDLASLRTRAEDAGDHWLINGQKVWTSNAYIADWGLLLARTDPSVVKYQGISAFLINMRQAGVEVRPLKKITGGSEFCEVFFSNARVEKENLLGPLNQGWQVTQTTLGFERGSETLNLVMAYMILLRRLVEVSKQLKVNDHSAFADPLTRQKLGRAYVEIEVLRYSSLRILTRLEKGERPGPESSILKLYYSEFEKRFLAAIMEILGPYGGIVEGMPHELAESERSGYGRIGVWGIDFLQSFAPTIYVGTSEIQKNIIGERVLGLPKEPRMDRIEMKAAQSK